MDKIKKIIAFLTFPLISLLFALMALLMTSCQSQEYYTEEAVIDARFFALKRLKELDPIQRNYIRYNKPVLMNATYMGSNYWGGISPLGGKDFAQMCVVWNIPGEELPVIVFGTSAKGIRGWKPIKIIRRKFRTHDATREAAIRQAMLYAVNNMLYLSDDDQNNVRFSAPEAVITNFDLDFVTAGEKFIALSKQLKHQISFVWPSTESGRKVVVSGICSENFANWVAVSGWLEQDQVLKSHTVGSVVE
ncbi:MAG: hypothetical protein JXR78_02445 [Victivallales bacterium]|nr:hypothetical protein [Victivallales bacterium]